MRKSALALFLVIFTFWSCREDMIRNNQAGVYLLDKYERLEYINDAVNDQFVVENAGSFVLYDQGSDTYNAAFAQLDSSLKESLALASLPLIWGEENQLEWYVGNFGDEKLVIHATISGPFSIPQLVSAEFYLDGHGKRTQRWIYYTVIQNDGSYIKEIFHVSKQ